MSIDPGQIRAEAHTEIGEIIERDAAVLMDRWSRRAVQEQPNAKRAHHQALLDHLQEILQALGRSLAESDDMAASQHCLPATVHGEQRWETGWSLPEVVRDYQILRLVILDYLDEILEEAPSPRVLMAIGLALDEAISVSVLMYVKSRDEHLRQIEAERVERDKQIQDQLRRQAEALRQVDRRKNEFLAILGHELRNPLAPLWHVVKLQEIQASTDPDLMQIRDITQRQVQQLSRLADDLLDIARIAEGKFELRKEVVNLADLLAQAGQACIPQLKARHHQFEVTPPSEPLWLNADPVRFVQIIVNLLNNAAKYTEPGGQVWLSAQREGEEAIIRVRDTGIGIPAELLPHVFELFTQGEWSMDRSQGGMGVGLALVKQLVEAHGGTISASSPGLGQGSEFAIRLRAVATPVDDGTRIVEKLDANGIPKVPRLKRCRILIVDDNVDAAQSLSMLLSMDGHEVQVAHDGPGALNVAATFQPGVILLDIGLPRMDGYEVARRLRQQLPMENVLLLALTGYGREDDRVRSQEAGFKIHLVKPVDLDVLRAALPRPESPEQNHPENQ